MVDIIFKRIKANKPFDSNLRLYKKSEIEDIMDYYINIEDYEKCEFLKKFIEERYSHELSKYNLI